MKKRILWVTETAVMLALLIVLQWATKPLGQIVTGSCVNAVLVAAVLLGGLWCGLTVAVISPFCAFLLGIGPQLIAIIPAIALGNAVLVLVLHFVYGKTVWRRALAWLGAAVAKSAVLYLVVVQLLCRVLPLKQPQIDTFTAMFSAPQLVTALIGGGLVLLIMPALKKALNKH
ncbi:MAG: hypothetical protein IJF02_01350 [Oscillospiraceae bacterium]|nr:hypothetical protein [Oscillospiraceae bacterium]